MVCALLGLDLVFVACVRGGLVLGFLGFWVCFGGGLDFAEWFGGLVLCVMPV